MPSWLFHNNGDGTFTDVSQAIGHGRRYRGKAWGVVAADINNDGCMDLFVANDTVANFLFMNRGRRQFEEIGTQRSSVWRGGTARSGMGVDAADFEQDGWMDLFVANIDQELYSIYQNNHDETFDDHVQETRASARRRD